MPSISPVGATIPAVTHHVAQVNGTSLHYVAAGDGSVDGGSPVLLVHGFPETWWAFRGLIPLLAAHHRVYAVDLRGFGDSAVATDDYSSAVAAQDLHALIAQLSVGPMHVVGQDVSGGAVYRLAATHPADVLSLTAVESGLAGFGAERLADVTRGGAWYIGVGRLLFETKARGFIGSYLYPFYGVSSVVVTSADVDEFARTYGRAEGFSGAAGLYRSMLTEGDELRALSEERGLRMPVAAIGSRGGRFTHSAFGAAAGRDVSDIRVDSVGHYVAQEAPAVLAEKLLGVFARAQAIQ